MPMPVEIKDKWTTALRSGKYPQGDSALKKLAADGETFRYCCWGVLAEVMEVPQREARDNDPGTVIFSFPISWYGSEYSLDASGMPATGWYKSLDVSTDTALALANMNDGSANYTGDPQTFDQIADYIDANL